MVIIDHGNGYGTLYSHLEKIEIENGANVAAGASIGTLGDTGHSGPAHLHFMVVEMDPSITPGDGGKFYKRVVPFQIAAQISGTGQPAAPIASDQFVSTLGDYRVQGAPLYEAGASQPAANVS